MEFQEVLKKRRSIRRFKDTSVSKEQIDTLMHAAMSGPSCRNEQSWEIYGSDNEKILEALSHVGKHTNPKGTAALILCGNMDRTMDGDLKSFWIQDVSAAVENVLLCCTDLGLGAVWIGCWPKKGVVQEVKNIFALPQNIEPMAILMIGYPDEEKEPGDYYDSAKVHWIEGEDE